MTKTEDIYTRAAELIDSGAEHYSCIAVDRAAGHADDLIGHGTHAIRYAMAFGSDAPTWYDSATPMNRLQYAYLSEPLADRQNLRTLALCFMAAAYKDL